MQIMQNPAIFSGNNSGNLSLNSNIGGRTLLLKDLEPNQKNINLYAIVLEIGKPSQTKDGHEVRNIRIADKRLFSVLKISCCLYRNIY